MEPSLEGICEGQLEQEGEKRSWDSEGNSLCEESEGRRKRAQKKQKNGRQGMLQGEKGKEGVSVKKEKPRIQGETRKRGSGTPGESER